MSSSRQQLLTLGKLEKKENGHLSMTHLLSKKSMRQYFTQKFGSYSSLLDRVDAIVWYIENPPVGIDKKDDKIRIKHNYTKPGMFGFQLQCDDWVEKWISYKDFIDAVISYRWSFGIEDDSESEYEEDITREEIKDPNIIELYKEIVLYLIKVHKAEKYLFDSKYFSTGDFDVTFEKLFSDMDKDCTELYCKLKMFSKRLEEMKMDWRNLACRDIFDQIRNKNMLDEMEKHFDMEQCRNLKYMNSGGCTTEKEGQMSLEFTMVGEDIKRLVKEKVEC